MCKNKNFKHLTKSFLLLISFFFGLNANATLLNSDFSLGFDNWQAAVTVFDGTDDISSSGDLFATYPDSYTTVPDSAILTTNFDAVFNDVWEVVMFQDFQLDNILMGSSLWLSLDVLTDLTDPLSDFAFAYLKDDMNNILEDLTLGGSFDVTAYAGDDVSIEFGVLDGDLFLGDTLTVSNIKITEMLAPINPVPAPATLFLFVISLCLIKRSRG
ncbi:hypothetical protein [Paraglaciecola sp. L3A3]|uniref:hypothetical protein n=1 Tax=Paraglaciecola sp. L3A3 TaxID=2686358 RepID=UPI00131EB737|nr:hypothetical protein [Paraglaciecola sp. L3A3]